jgi:uncharacterized protein (UPF0332 family)
LNDFERCIEKGRLLRVEITPQQLSHELDEASKDQAQGERRLVSGRFEDASVHAYHAMYHAARTLLLARGFRERNLFCLAAGLRHFYVSQGKFDDGLLKILAQLKDVRDRIVNGGRSDRGEAQSAVAAAAAMLDRARALMGEEPEPPGGSTA